MYSLTMRSWLWSSRVASGSDPRGASRVQAMSMRPNTNHLLCSRPVKGGSRHWAISSWNGGRRSLDGRDAAAAAAEADDLGAASGVSLPSRYSRKKVFRRDQLVWDAAESARARPKATAGAVLAAVLVATGARWQRAWYSTAGAKWSA